MNIASIILTLLAVLTFIGGGYFAYDNKVQLAELRSIEDHMINDPNRANGLRQIKTKRNDEITERDRLTSERTSVETSTAELETQLADLQDQAADMEQGNSALEREVASQSEMVEEITGQVTELGNLQDVVTNLTNKSAQLAALTEDTAAANQNIASAETRIDNYDKQISDLRAVTRAQGSGEMVSAFSTSVRAAFPDDGFVIIAGGYNRDVVSGAKFSFQRGGEQIGMGEVSSVHADYSVIRLDPDSTTASVAQGDRAVYLRSN